MSDPSLFAICSGRMFYINTLQTFGALVVLTHKGCRVRLNADRPEALIDFSPFVQRTACENANYNLCTEAALCLVKDDELMLCYISRPTISK